MKLAQEFTPDELASRTIERRAIEAINWGMPAVNADLMLQALIKAGDKTFKVHIDGYNMLDFLTKKGVPSPRKGFVYFDDDGNLVALRAGNWKIVFMEQRVPGTLRIWAEPFTVLRLPKLFNLRTDPFERADITSNSYYEWTIYHIPNINLGMAVVQPFLNSFKEFPPRQKAASFTLDQALDKMAAAATGR